MGDETRQYIAMVHLGSAGSERLAIAVPWIKEALDRASKEPVELVFRAVTGEIFGYFVRSSLVAAQIRARLLSPSHPGPLDNDDHVFVFEVGEDKDATRGFSRALTWLQRH